MSQKYSYLISFGNIYINVNVLKLGQFVMPKTGDKLRGLVNICVYYAHQNREFARYCLTQWISKLPGKYETRRVRQYLIGVVLFAIKDL